MKNPQITKLGKTPSSAFSLPIMALVTLVTVQNASAILTFDLRAVSAVGGIVSDTKTVSLTPGAIGASVTFELWAVVTGSNVTIDETLTSGLGSIMSSPANPANRDTGVAGNTQIQGANTILGGLTNTVETQWRATGTTNNGPVADLDGDGDADVGGNSNAATTNYIVFNGGGAQNGTAGAFNGANFHELSNGREFRISIATFNVTSVLTLGNSTGVNWVVPAFSSSLNENARASFATDAGTRNGADALLAVAAPVVISAVPEPSAFGMVMLGALSMVGFRRFGMRRAS